MSDIGRVKKYEVYLAERQKRDLGGVWRIRRRRRTIRSRKMRNTVEVIKYK